MAGNPAGSGIMSSLATGAAVGAGMVAGEEIAHHLMDGGSSHDFQSSPGNDWAPQINGDMGGADFGVSDGGSWDDGSGGFSDSGFGGGDDWT